MKTPAQTQNHALTPGEQPRPKAVEGPQLHTNVLKERAKSAALDALRHPIKSSARALKVGIFATGAVTAATGSVPPGVESASNFVREKAGEAAEGAARTFRDFVSPSDSESQPAGDVPQDLMADLQKKMPEGTRIVDTTAQPGDGPWAMAQRANPGVSGEQLATAVDFMQHQPNVQDGVRAGEQGIGVPHLPKGPAAPTNQGQ